MYTEIEQQTLDINWYFTNHTDIAFAASGGGILPASIAKSQKRNKLLWAYFDRLPVISKVSINTALQEIIGYSPDERYLHDFVYMAKRGLFAFDRTVLNNFSATGYHLVAIPTNPLKLINYL